MKYGLIGEHLGHSFSPQIHTALGCGDYQLIPLTKEQFHNFMLQKEFDGINVTIPYKEAVFPYCDKITDKARKIGAINTIKAVKTGNGTKLIGDNTDFDGFLYLLEQNHIQLKNKTMMILGTGGTCKTVTAVAEYLQAKKILTVSRRAKNGCLDYDSCHNEKDVQVIVNTTPTGMYPNIDDCYVNLTDYPKLEAVIDVIFNPLETKLLQQGRELEIPSVNGLEMLVAQAKFAEEIFFDKKISDTQMIKVYQCLKKEIKNLVLIGMPGCGKSTVGKALAETYQKKLVDVDAEIETKAGMTIPEIFSHYGESYFRTLEKQVIAKIAKEHGQVIATGGGCIKNKQNIDRLKQNGTIIFIDRPLPDLEIGNGRPLSTSLETVSKLYTERYPLYVEACDIQVKNTDTIKKIVAEITKEWEDII